MTVDQNKSHKLISLRPTRIYILKLRTLYRFQRADIPLKYDVTAQKMK